MIWLLGDRHRKSGTYNALHSVLKVGPMNWVHVLLRECGPKHIFLQVGSTVIGEL